MEHILVSSYAIGKRALAICDRCGFQKKYLDLKKEWNGHKVCKECYEPKAPQVDPLPVPTDPQALYEARPDQQEEGGVLAIGIKNSGDDFANFDSLFENNVPAAKAFVGGVTVST